MPIFQKVANNAYDALSESRFIKRSLVARHRKAEKLIAKSLNIAKGYIDLAKVYIEKSNLRRTLEIYNHGIRSILSSSSSFIDNKINSNHNFIVDSNQHTSQHNNDGGDANIVRKKLNGSHK